MAILLVFLYHCSTLDHDLFFRAYPGWAGVDLFFELSGLLITGLLLDARGKQGYYGRFILRRGLRIFPLYYARLAVVFIGIALGPATGLKELLPLQGYFWTYTANLFFAFKGWPGSAMMLDHFWSLCVEEQFYLLWWSQHVVLERRFAHMTGGGLLAYVLFLAALAAVVVGSYLLLKSPSCG